MLDAARCQELILNSYSTQLSKPALNGRISLVGSQSLAHSIALHKKVFNHKAAQSAAFLVKVFR